jgi:5-methylcytosine-specific restriction endonuclease McrA
MVATELEGQDAARACAWCGGSMEGKRSSALACSVACNNARLNARRVAAKWDGVDAGRPCENCGVAMVGKRPHARYCSRKCKTAASDVRRRESGAARERDRARYASEAETRRAYARQYLQDNPERMRAIRLKRKARIRAASFAFSERDWRRLLDRYRRSCAYCGDHTRELQREHVIPLVRGGTHGVGNIIPACPPCNYAKKDKLVVEWRRPSFSPARMGWLP